MHNCKIYFITNKLIIQKRFSLFSGLLGFLFTFFTITPVKIQGQDKNKIDSLSKIISQSRSDTLKVNAYLALSDEYEAFNQKASLINMFAALALSKKINWIRGEYRSLYFLGYAYSLYGMPVDGYRYCKQAYDLAVKQKNSRWIMETSLYLGQNLKLLSKYDSANRILNIGMSIAKKLHLNRRVCDFLLEISGSMYYIMKYDSADALMLQGLELSKKMGDSVSIVTFYNNLATTRLYRGMADSEVAGYIMNAIRINEKNKDWIALGDNYSTLASYYNLKKNSNKTIFYLRQGLILFEREQNDIKTIIALVNLADQFRDLNKYDSAEMYIDKAIHKGEKQQYLHGLAAAFCMKGYILSKRNEHIRAEYYLQKAYRLSNDSGDGEVIILSGNYYAQALLHHNKTAQAEIVANNVLKLSGITKNWSARKTASETLAEINHINGYYDKAFQFLKISLQMTDSVQIEANNRLMEEMESKYQAEKKDYQIALLTAKSDYERKQMQAERVVFITTAVLVVFITGMILMIWFRRKKEAFERKINDVSQTVKRLQLNPHFLKNSLSFIDTYILSENDSLSASRHLGKLQELMNLLMEYSEKNEIPFNGEIKMLKNYIELMNLMVSNKVKVSIDIDPQIDMEQINVPPSLIQPVVENVFKYAYPGVSDPVLDISFRLQNELLHCVVTDNGVGKQFEDISGNQFNRKTGGYGLNLIKERIEILNRLKHSNGFLKVEYLSEKILYSFGTRVEIAYPISYNY